MMGLLARYVALIALLVGGSGGCGPDTASAPTTSADPRGTVDRTLPADQQRAQESVAKLLNAFLEGATDEAGLGIYAPGIKFAGDPTKFLENQGTLLRWSFRGPPQAHAVPVVLYFDPQRSGQSEPQELKTWELTLRVKLTGRDVLIGPE